MTWTNLSSLFHPSVSNKQKRFVSLALGAKLIKNLGARLQTLFSKLDHFGAMEKITGL